MEYRSLNLAATLFVAALPVLPEASLGIQEIFRKDAENSKLRLSSEYWKTPALLRSPGEIWKEKVAHYRLGR